MMKCHQQININFRVLCQVSWIQFVFFIMSIWTNHPRNQSDHGQNCHGKTTGPAKTSGVQRLPGSLRGADAAHASTGQGMHGADQQQLPPTSHGNDARKPTEAFRPGCTILERKNNVRQVEALGEKRSRKLDLVRCFYTWLRPSLQTDFFHWVFGISSLVRVCLLQDRDPCVLSASRRQHGEPHCKNCLRA